MDGKVFTQQTKERLVQMADDMIELNMVLELVDGPALSAIISWLDQQGDKIIPDEVDPHINSAVIFALDGDYDEAGEEASIALNMVIDLPGADEDEEAAMIKHAMLFIISVIKAWISKKEV